MPRQRHRDKNERPSRHRHSGHRRRADRWACTSSDISDYEILPSIKYDKGSNRSLTRDGRHKGILGSMDWAGGAVLKGLNKLTGNRPKARQKGRSRQGHHISRRVPRDTQVITTSRTPPHRQRRELDISPENGDRMVVATFDSRKPGGGYMTSSRRVHGRKRNLYNAREEGRVVRHQSIRSHRLQRPAPARRLTPREEWPEWSESEVSVRSIPRHAIRYHDRRIRSFERNEHEDEYGRIVRHAPKHKDQTRKARRTLSTSSFDDDESSDLSEVGPANTESLKSAFSKQEKALRHSRLSPRQIKRNQQKAEEAKRLKEEEDERLRQEEEERERQRLDQERLNRIAEEQRQRQAAVRRRQEDLRRQEEERRRAEEAERVRLHEEMRKSVPYGRGLGPIADKTGDPGRTMYWDPNHNEPRPLPNPHFRYNWLQFNEPPPPGHFWDLDEANRPVPLPTGWGPGVYWPWAAPTRLRTLNPAMPPTLEPQRNHYWVGGREQPVPHGFSRMDQPPWSIFRNQ